MRRRTSWSVKVRPLARLRSDVLTCKLVLDSLVRPVDSGNCRRSPPKTSILAATSGRPPARRSALPFDHFGKDCSRDVHRFFRPAPVAVEQTPVILHFCFSKMKKNDTQDIRVYRKAHRVLFCPQSSRSIRSKCFVNKSLN